MTKGPCSNYEEEDWGFGTRVPVHCETDTGDLGWTQEEEEAFNKMSIPEPDIEYQEDDGDDCGDACKI